MQPGIRDAGLFEPHGRLERHDGRLRLAAKDSIRTTVQVSQRHQRLLELSDRVALTTPGQLLQTVLADVGHLIDATGVRLAHSLQSVEQAIISAVRIDQVLPIRIHAEQLEFSHVEGNIPIAVLTG